MAKRKTHEQFIEEMKNINPNITILEKYINAKTKITVQCERNHVWKKDPDHLLRGQGCPICKGKTVLKEFNDVATTHPDIAKYFLNQDLIYSLSAGSNKKIEFKCPQCNSISEKFVYSVCERGFRCDICNDGISFPERLIIQLLLYLNIEFIRDKTMPWSHGKRYDFYIKDKNLLIEIHGRQHFENSSFSKKGGRTIQEEQENDKFKEELAYQNDINDYIIIDARISEINYIKNNILNSKLSKLYDLSSIDWNYIDLQTTKNLTTQICNLWNLGKTISEIQELLGIHDSTIRVYLNKGVQLGICDYNKNESRRRGLKLKNTIKFSKRMCICLTTNTLYESITSASKNLNISRRLITECCQGKRETSGKQLTSNIQLKWEYFDVDKHNINDYILVEDK